MRSLVNSKYIYRISLIDNAYCKLFTSYLFFFEVTKVTIYQNYFFEVTKSPN